MRIVLLHVPAFKIHTPDQQPYTDYGPPPAHELYMVYDESYKFIPYGLMSLAAQSKTAGYETHLLNLADFPWVDIELLVKNLKADFWGLSCLTINRRGVDAVSRLIREHQPDAHICTGGPHATAMAEELLANYPALDSVVRGEGETTLMELLKMLSKGEEPKGLDGLVWREGEQIVSGAPRERITDLDRLIPPTSYFTTYMINTSRGCPGDCSFCSSKSMWGRKVQFHSAEYILDMLEHLVSRRGLRFLDIADDTFTANKNRAMAICQGIIDRKLNFVWTCMTRVDAVNEELLFMMRKAGCSTVNLGVESTDSTILRSINKKITADQVLQATEMAKKFGFIIRHFMMAGNRLETQETLEQSMDFLRRAKPHQSQFNLLALYPGTAEFDYWKESGGNPQVFFTHNFLNPAFPVAPKEHQQAVIQFLKDHSGMMDIWNYSSSDMQSVMELLPDLHLSHMEMGMALYREARYEEALNAFEQALDLEFPIPHVPLNNMAVCYMAMGDADEAEDHLFDAQQEEGGELVARNLRALDDWRDAGEDPDELPALEPEEYSKTFYTRSQPSYPTPFQMRLPGYQHGLHFGSHWKRQT